MRRPPRTPERSELTDGQRRTVAERAVYVGSPEHKDKRWWGGLPEARQLRGGRVGRHGKQTTTVCPLTSPEDRNRATGWLRSAIRAGQYRFVETDQDFPKKVWCHESGQAWFGLCVNTKSGEYKGWPIDEDERRAVFD